MEVSVACVENLAFNFESLAWTAFGDAGGGVSDGDKGESVFWRDEVPSTTGRGVLLVVGDRDGERLGLRAGAAGGGGAGGSSSSDEITIGADS